MTLFITLAQSITSLIIVYLLAVKMLKSGVLKEEHSLVLARIVTDLCLPAVVFVNLATQRVTLNQIEPSALMLSVEISCIILAWVVCYYLKFPKDVIGAVVFCSAFGSSTFLGYAVIMEMFPGTSEAMTEAVLISEIGVGYPIFILGPLLAAYFGSKETSLRKNLSASFSFFKSPVFFALILGVIWVPLGMPGKGNVFLKPLFDVCTVLSHALTPLALISVGLMFRIPDIRSSLVALAVVIALKLILKPVLLGIGADFFGFEKLWKDVLIILGAMPPAVLGAVFLRRYGGNASLASALLLVATCISAVTVLIIFFLMG